MCATKFPAITKAGKAPPSGRFDYRKIVKLQISPVAKMENQLTASAQSRSTSAEVIVTASERPDLALAWRRIANYGCLLRLSGASGAHPAKISTDPRQITGKAVLIYATPPGARFSGSISADLADDELGRQTIRKEG